MKKLILGISIIFILLGSVLPAFAEFQMAQIPISEGATLGLFILNTETGDVWVWYVLNKSLVYHGRCVYGLNAVTDKQDGLIRYYPAVPEAKEIKRKK